MGEWCRGVMFFRWPTPDEPTAMPVAQVLEAASGKEPQAVKAKLEVGDRGCAAVYCADLRLVNVDALRKVPTHFVIRSSKPISYYLRDRVVSLRLTTPTKLEFQMPAYPGHSPVPLGRIVADAPVHLQLQESES